MSELRSLLRTAVLDSATVLLPATESVEALLATTDEATVAAAATELPTLNVIEKPALPPLLTVPRVQVNVVVPVQMTVALAYVAPVGTGTETTTLDASEGPLLATEMV